MPWVVEFPPAWSGWLEFGLERRGFAPAAPAFAGESVNQSPAAEEAVFADGAAVPASPSQPADSAFRGTIAIRSVAADGFWHLPWHCLRGGLGLASQLATARRASATLPPPELMSTFPTRGMPKLTAKRFSGSVISALFSSVKLAVDLNAMRERRRSVKRGDGEPC